MYSNWRDVRRLVYNVSLDSFGPDHPATKLASNGPASLLREARVTETAPNQSPDVEVIPDLEKTSRNYIS